MNSRQEIIERLDRELAGRAFQFDRLVRVDFGNVSLLVGPLSDNPAVDSDHRYQITVIRGFPPDENAVRGIPFWLLRKGDEYDFRLRYLGETNEVGHLSFESVADSEVEHHLRVSVPNAGVHRLRLPGRTYSVDLRRFEDQWDAAGSLNWFGTPAREPSRPFFLRWHDLRILIAEDNRHTQRVMAETLESAGAQVARANDGLQAIEMVHDAELRGAPFDAIVMDLRMPRLDGCHATQRLRDAGYDRPIIGLTAAADFEKAFAAGCDDCVVKTSNSHSRLIRVLKSTLSDHWRSVTSRRTPVK